MNTLVQTQQSTQIMQSNGLDSKIDLIKSTVAKGATDDELKLFLHLSNKYNLDPFAKEIWFIKYSEKGTPSIFTSRDGYLKIAHASGVFDGMESYTIDDNNGKPIKAVATVYRKDMSHPFKAEIKVSEYFVKSKDEKFPSTWEKYPSAMAIKVAEVFALKRAFSISGLVTKEEMYEESQGQPVIIEAEETTSKKLLISDAQRKRLYAIAGKKNWESEQVKDYLKRIHGFVNSEEITRDKYEEICNYLETREPHWQHVEGQTFINAEEENS